MASRMMDHLDSTVSSSGGFSKASLRLLRKSSVFSLCPIQQVSILGLPLVFEWWIFLGMSFTLLAIRELSVSQSALW